MSVVLFAARSDKIGKAIMKVIRVQRPEESVEICSTVDCLALTMSQREGREESVILVPAGEEELMDVYSVRHLLGRARVMIVLPNKDEFLEAMGSRFYPRVMCHKGGDVTAAVSKLWGRAPWAHPRNTAVRQSFGNDYSATYGEEGNENGGPHGEHGRAAEG